MQNMLSGLLGGGASPVVKQTPSRMAFKSYLTLTMGDALYNTEALFVALVIAGGAGVNTLVWQYTVPPQQWIHWGFGSPAFPDNQGYMYYVCVDEATGFSVGQLQLVQSNARGTKRFVVAEFDDSQLHTATATTSETGTPIVKDGKQPLPEKVEFPLVGEDSLLQLWYQPRALPAAVDAVAFSIPITVYQ